MPNEFKFEVYFHKSDIQELLDEGATDLLVRGGLKYDASNKTSTLEIFAERIGDGTPVEPLTKEGCPMPCSLGGGGGQL